ncbi:ABC transporter ATP-binding protein [Paenibacillus urinalis]|uniref:ABC transporter ATP-binding protein n=1 Tax=Paenibacillus urinalis TaxID=521520 RepID=A0AAX3N044_9BACL|nr:MULTISPECIES: ABC transporter ATP-binding protein [Paenibacillus]WDH82993.1 ABC transporter ATP-binding protein [Paenibacillus urinalis]WDH99047.1 ABC transporter ATP-binding protein [Paenibacillus urinalis]WDI02738.1 ABC transporter ATP-binding protein [Paenibacillus urinalis]GAK40223.1 nitrate/sulfonate/bicarbonate ABC transporter ATP-binding protein [Paenibacillus sp. TCA20]
MHPLLEVSDIRLSFRQKKQQLHVLDHISLTVGQGEFVSIIGPSGSGKSSLFQIIGGLIQPDAGTIRLDGEVVTGTRGNISYMPQQPALLPWRTIADNIKLGSEVAPAKFRSRQGADDARSTQQWMAKAGLSGFEDMYPHKLSGGMQQRAAFLRALLSPQELMLLDEPFSALDALTRSEMQEWLLGIWEQSKRSVLFITHNIEEALLLSDRIYVFSNRPATVLHEVKVPFVRPRQEVLTEDPQFLRLKREISEWMREERRKQPVNAGSYPPNTK